MVALSDLKPGPIAGRNLTGSFFGMLTVKTYAGYNYDGGGYKRHYWACDCQCGGSALILQCNLKRQNSCGCLLKVKECDARPITFNGTTLNLTEWALKTGIPRERIRNRINRGWTPQEAVSTPVNSCKPLTNEEVEKIKELTLAGASANEIAEVLGRTSLKVRVKALRQEHGKTIYCRCGKVAGHGGWCPVKAAQNPEHIASLMSQLKDINDLTHRAQVRPRYERPRIENEFETEIPFLVNQGRFDSLDETWLVANHGGEKDGHELVASNLMPPDQILMLKEHEETPDHYLDVRRYEDFQRWLERRDSAFYEKAA